MTKTWRRHLPKWHKPYYYVWFIHIIHSSTGLFHLCYLFIYQVCFNHVIQSSTRSASSMLSLHLRGLLYLCYPLIYQVCIFHVIHSSIPGLFHLCYPSIYQVCFICVIHPLEQWWSTTDPSVPKNWGFWKPQVFRKMRS